MLKILIPLLVIAPALASAEGQGLCYDPSTKTSQLQTGAGTPPITSLPRDYRHWLAMKASQLVYQLSDLDTVKSGREMIERHAAFRAEALPQYTHWRYFSDRESGLKYAVFAPHNPEEPWIFAFAGTQSGLDWMSDLALGRQQLRRAMEFADYFTDCRNVDRAGVPIAGRNWIVTGHSLGGGLAQAFAFWSRSRRMLHRMVPGRLELVTFNGFGAMDLIGDFADVVGIGDTQLQSTNYFVTGDVVSRIGKHIGSTYEIHLPRGVRGGPVSSHMMTTVEAAVMSSGSPRFAGFAETAPPSSRALTFLKGMTPHLEFLTETKSESLSDQMAHVAVLREVVDTVLARRAGAPYDRDLLNYVYEITRDFHRYLSSMPQHDLRDLVISDLDKLETRILIGLVR